MASNEHVIWLAAGVRTPFVGVDGPFAQRDALTLSVRVVQAMAARGRGPIDFGIWGAVIPNLAYANLAREELAAMPQGSRAIVSICADGGLGTVALLQN